MKPILAVLTALLTLCGTSHSQEPSVITTHLLTYAPAGLPNDFTAFYQNANDIYQFRAAASNLGVPILYTGPQRLAIRSSKAEFALPPEQLKNKPPLAFVSLPPNADTVLLLCIPVADGKVRLVAYDVSSESLRPGSYRVFNFSSNPLSVIFGEQRFTVPPRSDKFIDHPSWHKEADTFPLQIATVIDQKVNPVYSSFWEHYPARRSVMFLFDSPRVPGSVIFSSFAVSIPPQVAATP